MAAHTRWLNLLATAGRPRCVVMASLMSVLLTAHSGCFVRSWDALRN